MLDGIKAKFFRELVVEADEDLSRCSCGKLVRLSDDKNARKHLGHELRRAWYFNINEWIRIKLGWL